MQNLSPTPLTPVCAAVYLVAALISMRYQVRYKVLITLAVPTAIGYIILIADPNNIGAKLFACFMAGSAIYVNVGLHVTWLGQNMAGFRKRSTGIGMQQTIGNIGGVIAGQIYRTQDKPGYRLGHAVCLAAWAVFAMGATAEYFIWRSRNAHRERMSVEEKEAIDAKEITGDHHYDFRYAL